MTEILLVVSFVVTLLMVMAIGYIWRLLNSLAVVATYITLFLNDKYEDFGTKEFKEME